MRPQRGVRGGPGMGRQRMGRPGMRGRPGIERQRFGGPEYFESPSIPDLHESDVSPESLADFPTNVRVVGVDEFDQTSFDELVPLIVRGAAARASKKWTDEWLLQRFGSVDCGVNLDSRPGDKQFRKHMTLAKYLATLAKSKTSHQPLEYLYQPRMEQEFEEVLIFLRILTCRLRYWALERIRHGG